MSTSKIVSDFNLVRTVLRYDVCNEHYAVAFKNEKHYIAHTRISVQICVAI